MKPVFLFCSLCLLMACKTAKQTPAPDTTPPASVSGQLPKIIFLNFAIKQDTTQHLTQASLINHIITDGKLKQDFTGKALPQEGDLICMLQDAEKKPLKQIILENPLRRQIEYANPSGQMERKMVYLEEAELSVRTQLEIGTQFITLEKVTATGTLQTQTLLQTKITQK